MQPKPAVVGEMAAGSLMVKPDVFKFHSSISHAPSLPKSVIVHTGNIAFFFWKAYLTIKQPLTAHGPIHPRVSSRHDP